MAISEAARADLYTGLREVLGPDRAELIMSAMPLHDLDEVATKADLTVLRAELEARLDRLEASIIALRAEFTSALVAESGALRKSFSNWMLTLLVTIVGAMVGVGLLT